MHTFRGSKVFFFSKMDSVLEIPGALGFPEFSSVRRRGVELRGSGSLRGSASIMMCAKQR